MASSRIKGITIEIDGNTTKLTDALKKVDKQARETQSSLRDINKLLKLDPGNTDLLAQKQKALSDAIDATKEKLQQEQEALNYPRQTSSAHCRDQQSQWKDQCPFRMPETSPA